MLPPISEEFNTTSPVLKELVAASPVPEKPGVASPVLEEPEPPYLSERCLESPHPSRRSPELSDLSTSGSTLSYHSSKGLHADSASTSTSARYWDLVKTANNSSSLKTVPESADTYPGTSPVAREIASSLAAS